MRRNFFYNKFSEMEIQIFLKKIEYERITRLVYVSIERNFKCYSVSLRFILIQVNT